MVRPRGVINVVCQNEKCHYYLKEKEKDIVKRGKYSTGHQRYFCHHCKKFFMETKGTLFYHKHLSKSEIIDICKHLIEKNGIRSIGRITGHHRDTIGQLLKDLTLHAEMVNSILINEVKLGRCEVDEMWSFIKENKRISNSEAQTLW
jgi:transposase-like protein